MEQQLILDRYRPLEELGEGAFGTVVLAWDTRMQRRVAIKRLPLPLDASGRPHRPHGLAEARTAAMLNHPAIVTVFDFDTDADEAFLTMEHVDGASLAELLDDVGGPLTLDEAATVIDQAASALDFAHDNGVLHLDIKPENVLVTRDGRVKVADFGISALSTLGGHASAAGGTPGYMPLEQLEGASPTERTDEWALAALAYETLTGKPAFAAATLEEAIARVEAGDPTPPSRLDPAVAREADAVVLAALALRASDRYPSVAAFADALLPYLGDPQAGRESLAELVDAYVAEEEADEDLGLAQVGLWDRLQGRLGVTLMRGVAAIEAGWLAWSGLTPFGLEPLALAAAVALVALAGVLAPGLGIGLGLGCFVAGLLRAGAWVTAAAVLVIGGAWWWFVARRSASASVLPLSAPVLATARLAFVQPLLAGFVLAPLRAGLTALIGGMLTMVASAASAQGPPYLAVWPGYALDVWSTGVAAANLQRMASSPAAIMALLGWPAAAAVSSVICRRATRASGIAGTLAGGLVLGLAYYLAEQVAETMGSGGGYTGPLAIGSFVMSLILVTLVASLGAPIRAEEERAFALATYSPEDDES